MSVGQRSRDLPLARLLPNMITVLALCAGLTGIRFALMGKWQEAALSVVIAGIFDMLDGRVARLLRMSSKFGAELDSLSDAISFGVAPGLIMYEWDLRNAESFGWIAVLVYAVCMALRLARFNTMLEDHTAPSWTKRYFTGVPAPGGAGLALLPLFIFLQWGDDARLPPNAVALWLIVVGGLLVSRLPTLSLKGWRIGHVWVAPIYAVIVMMVAAVITHPWLTLTAVGCVYLSCIPLGYYSYRRTQSRHEGTRNDQAG